MQKVQNETNLMIVHEIQLRYVTWECDTITESDRDVIFRKVLDETRSSLVETVTLCLVIIIPYHHKAVFTYRSNCITVKY